MFLKCTRETQTDLDRSTEFVASHVSIRHSDVYIMYVVRNMLRSLKIARMRANTSSEPVRSVESDLSLWFSLCVLPDAG